MDYKSSANGTAIVRLDFRPDFIAIYNIYSTSCRH